MFSFSGSKKLLFKTRFTFFLSLSSNYTHMSICTLNKLLVAVISPPVNTVFLKKSLSKVIPIHKSREYLPYLQSF